MDVTSQKEQVVCTFSNCGRSYNSKDSLANHLRKKHDIKKLYFCRHADCNEWFDNKRDFKQHTENQHTTLQKEQAVCTVDNCGRSYKSKHGLANHLREKHDVKTVRFCQNTDCNKWFDNERDFEQHKENQHATPQKEQVVCTVDNCGRSYNSKHGLANHLREKHNEKTVRFCQHANCNKWFKNERDFEWHKENQHATPQKKKVICTVNNCRRSYKSKKCLAIHLRRKHTIKTVLFCQYTNCNKWFDNERDHGRHKENHPPRPPTTRFPCPHCPRTFKSKYYLPRHIKTHFSTTVHCCPVDNCKYACNRLDNLLNHVENHSFEVIKCPISNCTQSSQGLRQAERHSLRHVDGSFICPIHSCRESFTGYDNILQHFDEHLEEHFEEHFDDEKLDCPIENCKDSFSMLHELRTHVRKHIYGPFFCPICGESSQELYEIQKHILDHVVATFPCYVGKCKKPFTKIWDLQAHLKEHIDSSASTSILDAIALTLSTLNEREHQVHEGSPAETISSTQIETAHTSTATLNAIASILLTLNEREEESPAETISSTQIETAHTSTATLNAIASILLTLNEREEESPAETISSTQIEAVHASTATLDAVASTPLTLNKIEYQSIEESPTATTSSANIETAQHETIEKTSIHYIMEVIIDG